MFCMCVSPQAWPLTIAQHGATHAFVVQFGNMDDRNYYITHDPAHQAFKKEIESLIEQTTVVDFTNGKFQ